MKMSLNFLAAIAGFIAAGLWFLASRVDPNVAIMNTLAGPPKSVIKQFNRQTKLNTYAALFTGVSAALQAVALLI
jgi:hypothetical protein